MSCRNCRSWKLSIHMQTRDFSSSYQCRQDGIFFFPGREEKPLDLSLLQKFQSCELKRKPFSCAYFIHALGVFIGRKIVDWVTSIQTTRKKIKCMRRKGHNYQAPLSYLCTPRTWTWPYKAMQHVSSTLQDKIFEDPDNGMSNKKEYLCCCRTGSGTHYQPPCAICIIGQPLFLVRRVVVLCDLKFPVIIYFYFNNHMLV